MLIIFSSNNDNDNDSCSFLRVIIFSVLTLYFVRICNEKNTSYASLAARSVKFHFLRTEKFITVLKPLIFYPYHWNRCA